ncbi:MAG: inositol monophosphatase family protein [Acidobacteriota bacterium]
MPQENERSIAEAARFAVEAAWIAGRRTLAYFQAPVDVESKEDGTPVTRADREAEQSLRDAIHRRFPGDGILGEEFGNEPGTSGRQWILDPIDGTKSFVHGVPLYAVLVALTVEGEAVAGVIHLPGLGETVAGWRGGGCH